MAASQSRAPRPGFGNNTKRRGAANDASYLVKMSTTQTDAIQHAANQAVAPIRDLIKSLPTDYLDDLRDTVRHLNLEAGKLIASIDIPDVSQYYRMATDQTPALVTAVNNSIQDASVYDSIIDRVMGSIDDAFHKKTDLKPEWWYDLPEEYADQVDRIANLSLEMYHDDADDSDDAVKLTVMQERLFNHYARDIQRSFGSVEGKLITTTSNNYIASVLDARQFEKAPFNVMTGALPIMNNDDRSLTVPMDMEWDQSGE